MQNTSKGSTLTDRATTTKVLYNYLEYVSPADIEGIKKAYVTVGDKGIQAKPAAKDRVKIAEMYGKRPTRIVDEQEPTALISKISPEDVLYPKYQGFGNQLLRSALRRIVDEV